MSILPFLPCQKTRTKVTIPKKVTINYLTLRQMNKKYKTLISKISVTWAGLSVFVVTSIPTPAQIINGVEEIAEKTTVQINTDANPGGSGVIIQKEGNTYSVLTANHVVCVNLGRQAVRCRTDHTYTIRTHDGIEYPIKALHLHGMMYNKGKNF